MGCDIHMWLEYRKNGQWYTLRSVPCCECRGTGKNSQTLWKAGGGGEVVEKCWSCGGAGLCRSDGSEKPEENSEEPDTYYAPEYAAQPYHNRNYALFNLLAGVRGYDDDEGPLIPPRGVPDDASAFYRAHAAEYDWHSHSWLTFGDVLRLISARYEPAEEDYASEFIYMVNRVMAPIARKRGDDGVRLVFFFDN